MSPPRGSQNLEAARSLLTSKKPPFIAPPGLAGSTSHALKAVELEGEGEEKRKRDGVGGEERSSFFLPRAPPRTQHHQQPCCLCS